MRSRAELGRASMSVHTRAKVSARARSIAFARAGGVMVLVLILDQVTKHLVRSGIAVGLVRDVVPGVRLVHVRNTGVAFGFFSGGGALVLVFTLLALGALIGYFALRPT